jgi:hypothetical protein
MSIAADGNREKRIALLVAPPAETTASDNLPAWLEFDIWWGIAQRSGHSGHTYSDYPAAALSKAVLTLGGGFYLHEDGIREM